MSSLVNLRAAIIAKLQSEITSFHAVQAHGGRFNREELKRVALRSPAALVTVLGGPLAREGAQAVGAVQIAVFIVTTGTSAEKRDEAALILSEAVAGLAVENKWKFADAKAPESMRVDNLYSGDIDKLGVALWSVSWTQRADIAIFDANTLDDFSRLYTDWDLAPKDGVAEAQNVLDLQGTIMSTYGQLHMKTSAATAIAVKNTYQKAAGTTELDAADGCDMPVIGRLRHTGSVSKPFHITGTASVEVSADAKVTLAFAKGGVADAETEIEQDVALAEGAETFAIDAILSLGANEYVEVWVKADELINVTLTKLNLVAVAA